MWSRLKSFKHYFRTEFCANHEFLFGIRAKHSQGKSLAQTSFTREISSKASLTQGKSQAQASLTQEKSLAQASLTGAIYGTGSTHSENLWHILHSQGKSLAQASLAQ